MVLGQKISILLSILGYYNETISLSTTHGTCTKMTDNKSLVNAIVTFSHRLPV